MNRVKSFIIFGAFSLIVLGLPAIATAQWNPGNNGGYYPNGGNSRNGNYSRDIRGTLENLKNRAKDFEHFIDRGNGGYNGRYDDRNSRNSLKRLADQFTDATKDLAHRYGRGGNLENSSDEARRVIDVASQIDRELRYSGDGNSLQSQWNQIGYDLRVVSDTYGYRYRGGNRDNRNGNSRNNRPSWWPF